MGCLREVPEQGRPWVRDLPGLLLRPGFKDLDGRHKMPNRSLA